MYLSGFKEENFTDYKKPSMTIGFPTCSFKCGKWCQNYHLKNSFKKEVSNSVLIQHYLNNTITEAIVFAGLEPFDSWQDLKEMVQLFREVTEDEIIIYTGYNELEIVEQIKWLEQFKNIIIKFGRYIPNQEPHFDQILGVKLASPNQYAKQIS